MIGIISNYKAFDGERKFRCIVHNTCSDFPCLPCSIKLELLKEVLLPLRFFFSLLPVGCFQSFIFQNDEKIFCRNCMSIMLSDRGEVFD